MFSYTIFDNFNEKINVIYVFVPNFNEKINVIYVFVPNFNFKKSIHVLDTAVYAGFHKYLQLLELL